LIRRHLSRSAGALSLILLTSAAQAAEPSGGLVGFVEDNRGVPVAGAVVSLFGKGAGGSGLVTLSDSTGRFILPGLPAGAYTVRTLGAGHRPAPARQIVVFPNQDSLFTISLTPLLDAANAAASAVSGRATAATQKEKDEARRELEWLLRHKRRSVLQAREQEGEKENESSSVRLAHASYVPDLAGTLEVLTTPAGVGVDSAPTWGPADGPTSFSVVRLKGRIADSGQWTLGGLVSENQSATWRMAAEFLFAPGSGHELQAATGYGTRYIRPVGGSQDQLRDRSVGALSLQDRWDIDDKLSATLGGRFSYVGFLRDTSELDPSAGFELRRDERTTVRGLASQRTVVPGGDVLTLSGVSTGPALVFGVMDDRLRPERVTRYELQVDQALGRTTVVAHTFFEGVRDQVLNVHGSGAHPLEVRNGGHLATRGMGLSVGRRFGESVRGSMTYTFGHSWRDELLGVESPVLAYRTADFHDVAARVETFIEGSDTRVVAFYRLNKLSPDQDSPATSATSTRFDVQLSQGLPFLGSLTRGDWDFLLAVRNLFYETSEGALLDEVAVTNPPKRVLGGISVRF
jgi:hypothetical protein